MLSTMAFTLLKLGREYSCCSNLLRIKPEKTLSIEFFRSSGYVFFAYILLCQQRVTKLMTYRPFRLQSSSSFLVHAASY